MWLRFDEGASQLQKVFVVNVVVLCMYFAYLKCLRIVLRRAKAGCGRRTSSLRILSVNVQSPGLSVSLL